MDGNGGLEQGMALGMHAALCMAKILMGLLDNIRHAILDILDRLLFVGGGIFKIGMVANWRVGLHRGLRSL